MPSLRRISVLILVAAAFSAGTLWAASPTPTSFTVTNTTSQPVFANLILGQPPTVLPPNCTDLGTQIRAVNDPNLVFHSSVANKSVGFTPPPGVDTKGSYEMNAGETITYVPQLIDNGTASPAVTFNFFFTSFADAFTVGNNGCADPVHYPNATNLAEGSVNFGINGSVGSGCANADDTDISAVNGVNATLKIETLGTGWPASTSTAQNGDLGTNADKPGVFGWAATNCCGAKANDGYPNPTQHCAAPQDAPHLPAGQSQCSTPGGAHYAPIVGPNGTQYCDERSDTTSCLCNNQRAGNVTGGTIRIDFLGFI